MGWVGLAAMGIAVLVIVRLVGLPRGLGWFVACALMLGASGYALQGQATLPGHRLTAGSTPIEVDPGMVDFRTVILPATPAVAQSLANADEALRGGDSTRAVAGLLAATRASPHDATLWTGLGSALSAHDGGQLSPAAQFAFSRAMALAPAAPGPPFFLGMAHVQAGNFAAAKIAWLRALALAPRDAAYRRDIAERLVVLDEIEALRQNAPTR